MKFRTRFANEYFLVENRSRFGLDEYLPSSGLAVYLCDIEGSNEWQSGTVDRHSQLALLQADGRQDLESNLPGDSSDLFDTTSGIVLQHNTQPSTRHWDGTDSGLIVSNIVVDQNGIEFVVGDLHNVDIRSIREHSVAHLLIPDNEPLGVQHSITINSAGKLIDLSVMIDITHAYIGDLVVSLEAPSGQRVTLHNRSGGS